MEPKPKFDPTQPYDSATTAQGPTPTAKPKFNPSQPFENPSDAALKDKLERAKLGVYQEGIQNMLAPAGEAMAGPALMKLLGPKIGVLARNPLARIAGAGVVSGAAGAIPTPPEGSSRLEEFLKKGAFGAAGQTGIEAGRGVVGGVGRVAQTVKLGFNPLAQQQKAQQVLGSASDKLRQNIEPQLKQELQGKTPVEISPFSFMGKDPEVDNAVKSLSSKYNPYGEVSSTLKVDPYEAHQLRQLADSKANYKTKGFFQEPEVRKSGEELKAAADNLRQSLHNVSPKADELYKTWSESLRLAPEIEEKGPVATLTSESPDKKALLQLIGQKTGVPLTDTGEQLKAANQLSKQNIIEKAKGAAGLLPEAFRGAKNRLNLSE